MVTTLAEIRASGYEGFNEGLVEYIVMLGSTTGTPVDSMDIGKLLFGDAGEEITDRREINRRFWKQAESAPSSATTSELSESMRSSLSTLAADRAETLRSTLLDKIARARREAEQFFGHAEKQLEIVTGGRLELAGISGDTLDLQGEVQRILDIGFFELQPDRCTGNTLVFYTPEVIMDYTETSEVTPPPVNMGRYTVSFNYATTIIKVTRLSHNRRTADGYFHPFIGAGGGVCWGNEARLVKEYFEEFKWAKVFGILATLLQRFDPTSSPYEELGKFSEVDPAPECTGNPGDSCPDCGSPDVAEDFDIAGTFYVCNECGHDW